jgi:energy-coupling factor transporter ATP-binding protein EcfA2
MELAVPQQGERLVVVGNSGTGKTNLVKSILPAIAHKIIVDTKEDEDWSAHGELVRGEKIFGVGGGSYVWQPGPAYDDNLAMWNRFCAWALSVGKRMIYFDEFGDPCPSAREYPIELKRCVMRGRSRKLSIAGTTQEIVRCPAFLYGQAQHRYCFDIGDPRHRPLADNFMGAPIPWESIPEPSDITRKNGTAYRFMYRGPGTGLVGPLQLPQESG